MKKSLLLLCAGVLTAALFFPQNARACSCTGISSVLDAFEGAEHVVIARVKTVKETEGDSLIKYEFAVMTVEKHYKGGMKPGEEITFRQTGTSCDSILTKKHIGAAFLLYLGKPQGNPPWYTFGGCERSSGVNAKSAAEDFLYLDNIASVRGKTRISGQIRRLDGGSLDSEGMKLSIRQGDKVWEVFEDSNGVYEIYGLPEGEYGIEPELHDGWKISTVSTRKSQYIVSGKYTDINPNNPIERIPVLLKKGRHAPMNILVVPSNAVHGRLLSPSGQPMENVCLELHRVDEKNNFNVGCTDKNGIFNINEIAEGDYVLVVHGSGDTTSNTPFRKLYYPGVADRKEAIVFSITPGRVHNDIDFRIP